MEDDTHAGFAFNLHGQHLINRDFCVKRGNKDFYENHLPSKSHINNLKKPKNVGSFCYLEDEINFSSWNKHVKNHEALFSNAGSMSHAGSKNENRKLLPPMRFPRLTLALPLLLFSNPSQHRFQLSYKNAFIHFFVAVVFHFFLTVYRPLV